MPDNIKKSWNETMAEALKKSSSCSTMPPTSNSVPFGVFYPKVVEDFYLKNYRR